MQIILIKNYHFEICKLWSTTIQKKGQIGKKNQNLGKRKRKIVKMGTIRLKKDVRAEVRIRV